MIFGELSNNDVYYFNLKLKENQKAYFAKINNEYVGFSTITFNGSNENIIYLFIEEKYRSKGYGSQFFQYLLNLLKNNNYDSLVFDLSQSQRNEINIIRKFGGIHISTMNGIGRYVLKLK